ncbi:MAG: AI-2E family transporter [Pseudomonadota bacterium]|nr:AI-2E family transporter [Pseudomonadota bacterium]
MIGPDSKIAPETGVLSGRFGNRAAAPVFLPQKLFAELGVKKTLHLTALAVWILAIVALGAALYFARPILIPVATAFIISILLVPATVWLKRRGVAQGVRPIIVVSLTFGFFAYGLYLVIQPGAEWVQKLPDVIEQAQDKLVAIREAFTTMREVSDKVTELTDLGQEAKSENVVSVKGVELGDAIFGSARTFIVQVGLTTVLTYFFLASRLDMRRKFILLRSSRRGMRRSARMLRAIERDMASYMLTMAAINVGLGVATGLAMWAIGMPSPLVWGGLAAILNFVPYIGPTVMTVLLGLTGLVAFDDYVMFLAPVGIYAALNFIESNFVTPTLIGVRMTVSPLAIILAVAFWTWLWGPAGAVISIPALLIFKTICDHTEPLRPIGLLIGDADTFRPLKANHLSAGG